MLDFNKCQDVVVEWNRIANGGVNDVSEEALILQRKFCEEEFNEFGEAVDSSEEKEIVKELCDCIVVFSYHTYLKEALGSKAFVDVGINNTYFRLIYHFKHLVHDKELIDAFDKVMKSNYSKFPFIEEIDSPEQECKDIEERSNGRYTGVYYTIVKGNDDRQRYVFKDSNGKVVKPKTYKEPVL